MASNDDIECIRDDSTECDCPRCCSAEDAFWREQGEDDDRDQDDEIEECPGCSATRERDCVCWQGDVPGPAVQR